MGILNGRSSYSVEQNHKTCWLCPSTSQSVHTFHTSSLISAIMILPVKHSSTNFDLPCYKSTWLSLARSDLFHWTKVAVCQCRGDTTFIFSLQFICWILPPLGRCAGWNYFRLSLQTHLGFSECVFPSYFFMHGVQNSFIKQSNE